MAHKKTSRLIRGKYSKDVVRVNPVDKKWLIKKAKSTKLTQEEIVAALIEYARENNIKFNKPKASKPKASD